MQRLNKNFSLDIDANTASERMKEILTSKKRHGLPMQKMRNWMTAGFLLDEFGLGIMEYLLAMDDGRIPPERLKELLSYISKCNLDKGSVEKETSNEPVREEPAKEVKARASRDWERLGRK